MRTRLLTVTLAVVLALLGAVAVLAYVRQANERAVNGLKAQTVMYATQAISAGTPLSKAQAWLATEKVPESSLTTPAVQAVTAANEHLVMSGAVAKGQVLLANMLAKPGTLTAGNYYGPALPVPKGDIGVTMEMCLDADVAGYVQSGSYVVVFDTYATGGNGAMTYSCTSHQPPSKGQVSSRVVVAKVEVLSVIPASSQGTSAAAAQVASADPTNPASAVASDGEVFVTLAATSQAEAENLVNATTAGDPTFGLYTTNPKFVATPDGPGPNGGLNP